MLGPSPGRGQGRDGQRLGRPRATAEGRERVRKEESLRRERARAHEKIQRKTQCGTGEPCLELLRTLRNAPGPREAQRSRKKDKETQRHRKAGLGLGDQERPRDLETAGGRARAERASAQSRVAAGGGRAAVVLLILRCFSLSEALSVTPSQRQFIILQRGRTARCDPAA